MKNTATLFSLLLSLLLALLAPGLARAATLNFNGGSVGGCSYVASSKTYTCATLPLAAFNDNTVIASGYTVKVDSDINFGFNQGLQMSGTATLRSTTGVLDIGGISGASLAISGGTLIAKTVFRIGSVAQTISADITADSMDIGSGSATKITGSLTATGTGTIDLASHVTIIGPISGTTITTNSPVDLTGNINASVAFTLASGSDVVGNIVAPKVTLNPSSVSVKGNITAATSLSIGSGNDVTGTVSGGALTMDPSGSVITGNVTMTGNVNMGSGTTIKGDLVAKDVRLDASDAFISGNAAVNSLYLDWRGRVGQTITCTGAGASGCSCVTNNSGYNSGPNAPVCGTPPPSAAHHIQISHTGTALTCQPQTVTLTACANAACTAPHFSGSTTATLSPGGASFTITNGSNGAATVRQSSAGTAVLSATSSGITNASTCVNTGVARPGAGSCDMLFSDTGMTIAVPDHIADTVQTVTISALQAQGNNQSCVPLFAGGARSINFSCSYVNPSAGTSGLAAVPLTVGGTALASNAASLCSAAGQNVSLTFNASGVATTTLQYPEVGQMTLNARYAPSAGSDAGLVATGSDTFIVAPARFAFAVTQLAAPLKANPGTASDASGATFIRAGEAFKVVISAVNTNGTVTKNFGKESAAESYSLKQALVAPAGGVNAAIVANTLANGSSGNFGGMSNGVDTANSLSWYEAGIFSYTAKLVNAQGYLNAGAVSFTTGGTVNVGRFYPDHFDTAVNAASGVPFPCTFSGCPASQLGVYSHQPFNVTVSAYGIANASNTSNVLQNYQGSFARLLTLDGYAALGSVLASDKNPPAAPGGNGMANNTIAAGTDPASGSNAGKFIAGVATTTIQYRFADITTTPTSHLAPPTTIYLRATDSDGASSARAAAASSVEPALRVVSGRLLVANNYGAYTSPMPMQARAQFWNGSSYVNSSTDSNSTGYPLIASDLTFSNCLSTLKVSAACSAALQLETPPATSLVFSSGVTRFRLKAPGANSNAAADIVVKSTVIPFLPGAPGRISFGVYRAGPVIYLREVY